MQLEESRYSPPFTQGSLKDTYFHHTGKPPFTSCNVQVYNVRIPVTEMNMCFFSLVGLKRNSSWTYLLISWGRQTRKLRTCRLPTWRPRSHHLEELPTGSARAHGLEQHLIFGWEGKPLLKQTNQKKVGSLILTSLEDLDGNPRATGKKRYLRRRPRSPPLGFSRAMASEPSSEVEELEDDLEIPVPEPEWKRPRAPGLRGVFFFPRFLGLSADRSASLIFCPFAFGGGAWARFPHGF